MTQILKRCNRNSRAPQRQSKGPSMRTSKKSQLIQAALEIIDKKSLGLTPDSLAKASNVEIRPLPLPPARFAQRASSLVMKGKPSRPLEPSRELSARERLGAPSWKSATRADPLAPRYHTRRGRRGMRSSPWLLPREEILADPEVTAVHHCRRPVGARPHQFPMIYHTGTPH